MAKLKRMLTHPRKNESGQGALAIVLLLLMLGAVILTPLLVFMSTGVKAGQVYESKLQEFYAADAGVEDAIWNITYANLTTPANYTLADEVNNRTTNVTVEPVSGGGYSGYKIISTATSNSGGNTTIECCYGALNYSSLLDNAITSNGTICVKGVVNGTTVAEDCTVGPACNGTNCTELEDLTEPISWPSAEELSEYYYNKVKDYPYYGEDINIATNLERGPLYRDGTLDIYNGGSAGKNATLNGTVYVTGDVTLGKTTGTSRNFTLNLNNQTIFVESASADPQKALEVSDKCTIIGSGCIIAVGDIKFAPKGAVGSNTTFVLLMSINGTVELYPSGDFYGAIVGQLEVDQYPPTGKSTIIWTGYTDADEGIDFPMGQAEKKVFSYTIK